MSFPPSLTTRTVKGRFVTYPDGVGAVGVVRIVLLDFMQGPTDDAFVVPFDREIRLDGNGEFSVVLPATNDPHWTPSSYRITVTTYSKNPMGSLPVENKPLRARLYVPYDDTSPIDLADVVNMTPPAPGQAIYLLAATRGAPGGVASLGIDGKILSSQIPDGLGGGSGGGPVSWNDVQNKPTVFPALAPTFSEVTNKPATYPSSWTEVSGKPVTFTPAAHTHATSEITGLDTALAAKASTAALTSGLAGKADTSAVTTALSTKADTSALTSGLAGKADLVGGVLPTSQLPSIAVIDFLGSVSSQAAMLALTGQKGDWCIRTDLGQTWIITGNTTTQIGSWTAMPIGTAPVQTVNGQTGAVVLGKSDFGLGNVENTSDANKPVSTATATALGLKAPLANPTFTGTVSGVTAAMVGLGSVNNTSDANKPVSGPQQTALDLKADKTQLGAKSIVLNATEPVPSGTAAGTLVFRTAA